MPNVSPIITNFTAGELSPLLDGRVDVSKYYNGAKTLENFIILPTGGIKRRPGTYYVAEVKNSARKTRLIPFQFSTTQAYIIEAGDKYFRFYQNQGQILSSGSAYEITSPYLEAELFDLQFAQDADTLWITHPSYKTRKLTRGAATWDSYTKLMLHMNGTDASTTFTDEIGKTVTANGNAQIDTAQYKFGTGAALLDGTGDYLSTPDHADFNFGTGDFTIDCWIRVTAIGAAQMIYAQDIDSNDRFQFDITSSGGLLLFVSIGGVTKADYVTGAAISANTWHHVELDRSGSNIYIFLDGISQAKTVGTAVGSNSLGDIGAPVTIGASSYAVGGGSDNYYFNGWIDELRVSKGIARHTTANFTPSTSAYAPTEVTFALNNYAPTADPFGADASDNCPSCVSIHEQRIVFANTNNDPQKIWASKSGDYENMTTGTAAGDAYTYTIGSEQVNAIRWLSSGAELAMGTLGGVFTMSSGEEGVAITPTNVVVKRETSYGATGVVPQKIGDNVFYIQRNLKTVREFIGSAFVNTEGKLNESSFDSTILAEHITGAGITDMAYQQSPYNILWCVTSDGYLACLTRQIDQEVTAWSRQIIGGSFGSGSPVVESVAVIPGDGGDDEVWIAVKRTINSATVRYVEYFKPMDFGSEQEDGFFVDSGLTLDSPKIITGISKANPGVVTAAGHGFSNGDIVVIRGVKGMTEVNQLKFKVAGIAANTFQLTDVTTSENIDTSAYTTYSSGGEVRECVTSLSGLSHLNGETVDVCVDGVEGAASAAVASGAITISSPTNGGGEIHAGLEYTSTLKTMRIEAGSQQGTAQSKLKRISKTFVRLYKSVNMQAGNEDSQDSFDVSDADDDTNKPTPLRSIDKEIVMPSLWNRDGYIVIKQSKPLPLNILAVIAHLDTSDV